MKKFLTLLCIITCLFSFSACSKQEQYSEYQNSKLNAAGEISVQQYIPSLIRFSEQPGAVDDLDQYTAEEIEYMFEGMGFLVDGNGFRSTLGSFVLNSETTGKISVPENAKAETVVDKTQIIVRVPVNGEKKNAEVELVLSNDQFLKLESGALNPVSTFGELMQKAALNTLIGMSTVFFVLILISVIIACFGIIPKIQAAFSKKEEVSDVTGIENAVAQIAQQEEILDETDDLELIAVISAAIAAYEGSANTSGYVVRSIRKIR